MRIFIEKQKALKIKDAEENEKNAKQMDILKQEKRELTGETTVQFCN